MTPLLDVNVLVALAWPNHVHHDAAAKWMTGLIGISAWATTPVVQSGFIRVSCNRRILPDARSPTEAIRLLRELTALDGHEFWPDDIEMTDCPEMETERLTGYRQITDAHLLALAVRHHGCLATFDASITALTSQPDHVLVLRTGL